MISWLLALLDSSQVPYELLALVIFFFDLLQCFCNLIVKFTDFPFIFDDFAFLISFNFKCLT